MGIFFVLLFAPMALRHVVLKGYSVDFEKKTKRAFTLFFFLLTLLLMLRHMCVGNDTRNYIDYFNSFSLMSFSQLGKVSLEMGFSYFNKIISLISKDSQFFLAVVAIVTSSMIYPTYKRVSTDSSLTIVLFCVMPTFVMMFSGIRQMIAIGIGVVAYEFTRKKKLVPFILAVIFASLFHVTAVILFFMYPLYHARITRKWLYGVVPALVCLFVFNKPIFLKLERFIQLYTKYDGKIQETGAYSMLILFILFAVFAFIIPNEKIIDAETVGLRNFLLLVLVVQMFAPLHTLAMRLGYYYIIFIPLLLPRIISHSSARYKQVAVIARYVMIAFFSVYFFISLSGSNNLNVYPYHFFWENI